MWHIGVRSQSLEETSDPVLNTRSRVIGKSERRELCSAVFMQLMNSVLAS